MICVDWILDSYSFGGSRSRIIIMEKGYLLAYKINTKINSTKYFVLLYNIL